MSRNRISNIERIVLGDEGPRIDDPAELFMEDSKFSPQTMRAQMFGAQLIRRSEAIQHTVTCSIKCYQHRPKVSLPEPAFPRISIGEVLLRRRTIREFSHKSLSLVDLSTLLMGSAGITGHIQHRPELTQLLRSVPSGGALYPFEIYCAVFSAEGIAPGLYHYSPVGQKLHEIRSGNFQDHLAEASLGQNQLVMGCAAILVVTGMFWRSRFKYGSRGFRFTLMEVGHVSQNLLLTAESLDMAAVLLGGFHDDKIIEFVEVDGVNEAPLYLIAVGYKPDSEKPPDNLKWDI